MPNEFKKTRYFYNSISFFNYYYFIYYDEMRTYEKDAIFIERADDLENIVKDKREIWRSNPSKANRRQRRYKKRLISELLKYR